MECDNNLDEIFMKIDQFETSFLDLNDHCMLKVCGYLNLMDMINISRTCKRLSAVSLMGAKRFKCFNVEVYALDVRRREKKLLTTVHINRAVDYIAPIVESIEIQHFFSDELLQTLKKYNFPKLKSLSLNRCAQLRWFNNKNNIEALSIDRLKRSELNNYSSGITKVKELNFVEISSHVPISELLNFFENNPNIERLMFTFPIERPLPVDFFTKLKNLKILKFTLGQKDLNLDCVLQIENLTELILNYGQLNRSDNVANANNAVERFLTSIAQKQTLKSIDLRSIYFDELLDALAPLNLNTLRFVAPSHTSSFSSFPDFYSKIANTSFPALRHLDVVAPVDITTFFTLIKRLTALEKVQFSLLRPYDRHTFMVQLSQLLSVRKSNRPELFISFLIMSLKVKIYFNLGCYELREDGHRFAAVIPSAKGFGL